VSGGPWLEAIASGEADGLVLRDALVDVARREAVRETLCSELLLLAVECAVDLLRDVRELALLDTELPSAVREWNEDVYSLLGVAASWV
jgi:hypothetical protein